MRDKRIRQFSDFLSESRLSDAIDSHGKADVERALKVLYRWTRGDIFRIAPDAFDALDTFVPSRPYATLYKGVVHTALPPRFQDEPMDFWFDFDHGKERSRSFKEGLASKYTSWSTSASAAAKFATSNCILVLDRPPLREVAVDLSMVPRESKFSGELNMAGGIAFVPDNEGEVIMKLSHKTALSAKCHEVHFTFGKYMGDYRVDTLGLTKRPVSWHVSPV